MSKVKEFHMTYTTDINKRRYEIITEGVCLNCMSDDVDELIDCQHYIHVYKDGEHVFTGDSLTWLAENNFNNEIKKALMDLNKHRIAEFHKLYSNYIIEKNE